MDVPPSQQHQITHERTSLVLVHQLDMRRPKKPIVHPPTRMSGFLRIKMYGRKEEGQTYKHGLLIAIIQNGFICFWRTSSNSIGDRHRIGMFYDNEWVVPNPGRIWTFGTVLTAAAKVPNQEF